jgi:hypothetical protein
MVFGYAISCDWLLDYARCYNLDNCNETAAGQHAIQRILRMDRLSKILQVKVPENPSGTGICFPIAHNKTKEGLGGLTEERREGLRQAMGITDAPKWYVVN